MPKPSPNGLHVAHGVGGGYASVDNRAFSRGAVFGWRDDDTVVFANGDDDWLVSLYSLSTQKIVRVEYRLQATPIVDRPFSRSLARSLQSISVSANHGYAGGGHYATWLGANNETTGLWSSTGLRSTLAGLLGMGPDAAIAYKPDYHSHGPTLVRELDGSEWTLTSLHAYGLHMLGNRQAVWMENGLSSAGLPPLLFTAEGGLWMPWAAWTIGEKLQLTYYNGMHGIVLHPHDSFNGFSVLAKGDGWPSLCAISPEIVRLYVAVGEGEQAGQIWARDYDVVNNLQRDPWGINVWEPSPRVNIRLINQLPTPEIPTPRITITNYDPKEGDAPLRVKATYAPQPNAGPITRLEWLIRKVGFSTWDLAAQNPASDMDHTYIIEQSGTWEIKLRAYGPGGTAETGAQRIIQVRSPDIPPEPLPEPEPEPEPPPMSTAERFWIAPNIASKDMIELINSLSTARAGVDVVQLYVQNVLFDGARNQGPNSKQALLNAGVYRKLKQAGIPLAIEMGSVKPGDCNALNALSTLAEAVVLVRGNGGEVHSISMDEPLTARADYCKTQTLEACAIATSTFISHGQSLGVKVGWIEAWPHVDLSEQRTFLKILANRAALPDFWHLDIDWQRAKNENVNANKYMTEVFKTAKKYGIPVGIIIHTTVDPISTDAAHHQHLIDQATRLHKFLPVPERLIIQSWAFRTPANTGGMQDVPQNLGPTGLLSTFTRISELFTASPSTPTQENFLMSKLIDPLLHLPDVKAVKPISGTSLATLILANDNVFSCQPDGTPGERPAGTEGQYERCRVSGPMATFQPVAGKFYTFAFVMVDGL